MKSSKKVTRWGIVLVVAVAFLAMSVYLAKVQGYDWTLVLLLYVSLFAIASIVAMVHFENKYLSLNDKYNKLIKECNEKNRELCNLKKVYKEDYFSLMDDLELSRQRRVIADKSTRIYMQKAMEYEEIFEKIKYSYPNIDLEAEKAGVEEEIKVIKEKAENAYNEIDNCMRVYKKEKDISMLEKACTIYFELSARERRWLPSNKRIRQLKVWVERYGITAQDDNVELSDEEAAPLFEAISESEETEE